ncbi:MAG: sigma-70 family RNA polymerase sigma factor [Bacteroidetes bacterium]|nr:sigma-70 family RNA polymerase sigma factor [Bacteroidota bacterium]
MKKVLTDKYGEVDLIEGLKNGNGKVIQFIYKRNLQSIRNMVINYPNLILEAEDVLQEGLVRAITNIRSGKFNSLSSVHTYLYSICRYICLKEYYKTKQLDSSEMQDSIKYQKEDTYYQLLDIVNEMKKKLETACIEIIDLRFRLFEDPLLHQESRKLMDFETIAATIGISPDNARQRFSRCIGKLISAVHQLKGLDEYLQ